MQPQHAIVIDENSYKLDLVLVDLTENADGVIVETPQYWDLQPTQRLIYDGIGDALSMLKPRWDGNAWVETASQEEIEAARPPQVELPPTLDDRLSVIEAAMAELAPDVLQAVKLRAQDKLGGNVAMKEA